MFGSSPQLPQHCWIYHPTPSRPIRFLLKNLLIVLWRLPIRHEIFSSCFQNFLCPLIWQSDLKVFCYGLLRSHPFWNFLCSMQLHFYFLSQIWKMFSHYFFKLAFRSFLPLLLCDSRYAYIGPLIVSPKSFRLSALFFYSFHIFFSSEWIILNDISSSSQILSSGWSVLLLSPFSEYFN